MASGGQPPEEAREDRIECRHSLPRIAAVEMPGGIHRVDEAIASLGGPETVRHVLESESGQLQVRLVRDYAFAAPLPMERKPASHLLVRMKRKKDGSGGWDSRVVGVVDTTFTTNAIPDFICAPGPELAHGGTVVAGTCENELAEGDQGVEFMPPAFFTRIDQPVPYEYEDNAFVARGGGQTVVEAIGTGEPMLQRAWVQISVVRFVDDGDSLPRVPPEGALGTLSELDERVVKGMDKLFKQRAIWLRGPLEDQLASRSLPRINTNCLQKALRLVAYHFGDGPWRGTYVRLGFDPRKNPQEAKLRQVIDFRDRRRRQDVHYFDSMKVEATDEVVTGSGAQDHYFRMPPTQASQLYQLCDIEDDIIQEIVRSANVLEKCSEKTGWLPEAALEEVRTRMHVKTDLMRHAAKASSGGSAPARGKTHQQDDADAQQFPKRRRVESEREQASKQEETDASSSNAEQNEGLEGAGRDDAEAEEEEEEEEEDVGEEDDDFGDLRG